MLFNIFLPKCDVVFENSPLTNTVVITTDEISIISEINVKQTEYIQTEEISIFPYSVDSQVCDNIEVFTHTLTNDDKFLPVLSKNYDLETKATGNGFKLRDYQYDGIKFILNHPRCLLADDMGLGKTIQTVLAVLIRIQHGDMNNCLILVPKQTISQWYHEFKKNSLTMNISIEEVVGNISQREFIWAKNSNVCICSYDTFSQDSYLISPNRFDCVVLDEAQKIKNGGKTIRALSIYSLTPKFTIAMSGTPLENHEDDVINIFRFVDPKMKFTSNNLFYVRDRIAPYTIRRTREDVNIELPELGIEDIYLDLSDSQKSEYDEITKGHFEEHHIVEDGKNIRIKKTQYQNALVLINKQKQICNRGKSGESSKMEYVEDILTNNDDKFLLFTNFAKAVTNGREWIVDELNNREISALNFCGNVKDISEFANTNIQVFVANPKTGGIGLNGLTVAKNVIHFDHWWTNAVTNQADARCHRSGQTDDVVSYRLWTNNTVETKLIKNKLMTKQQKFNCMFDENDTIVKDYIKEYYNEEFRRYVENYYPNLVYGEDSII